MDLGALIQNHGGRQVSRPGQHPRRPLKQRPKKRARQGQGPEALIQKSILDYLRLRRNGGKLFYWRQQGSGTPIIGRYGEVKGMRPSTSPGAPDIFVIREGLIYGLEVKSKVGRQSDIQKLFQEKMEAAGAVYGLVRSIEDVQALGL